jgi:hypothetical protein
MYSLHEIHISLSGPTCGVQLANGAFVQNARMFKIYGTFQDQHQPKKDGRDAQSVVPGHIRQRRGAITPKSSTAQFRSGWRPTREETM